jgi:hypothetical protein
MISLASRLMVVHVTIMMWEGRRLDREVTRKTIEDNNVQDDEALRVNKLIVAKDSMKEYRAVGTALRNFVYARTLPWKDNGDRALLRQGYMQFVQDFHKFEQDYWAAVDQFVTVKYPAEVAKASFRMADAYNPDDYPHPEELRTRFRLTLDIDAIADASDFRVKLDDATVEEIREKIAEATNQRVHNAMKDVWTRVEEMVKHFANRTEPEASRLHETMVTNMLELVHLLPSLNLLGDPTLNEIGERMRTTLCAYDVKDLRKNPSVRKAANADAQEIINAMGGFMAAFGK